jgi:hypothetical protein
LASIPYLVRNVFEHIKEKNDIKSVSELGISLVNIVTTDSAALTHIAFQPAFIKIETPSLPSHILSQPVAARPVPMTTVESNDKALAARHLAFGSATIVAPWPRMQTSTKPRNCSVPASS